MPSHRHKILVVEDYEPLRYAFAALINQQQHCDVETTEGGADTLTLLGGGYRPCLVLLDVMLPDMDGWALRDQLGADGCFGDPSVIMISASPELLRAPCRATTATMLKPFSSEQFWAAFATHARCA